MDFCVQLKQTRGKEKEQKGSLMLVCKCQTLSPEFSVQNPKHFNL
jgi:hypothetical protein